MIVDGETEQLQNEQIRGSKAQHSYDEFIRDFVEEKRQLLFLNFQALPLSAEEELLEIKRMLYAVDTLEQDIMTVIETGRLASISLSEIEQEVKH